MPSKEPIKKVRLRRVNQKIREGLHGKVEQ